MKKKVVWGCLLVFGLFYIWGIPWILQRIVEIPFNPGGIKGEVPEDWQVLLLKEGNFKVPAIYLGQPEGQFNAIYIHPHDALGKYQFFSEYNDFGHYLKQQNLPMNLLAISLPGWGDGTYFTSFSQYAVHLEVASKHLRELNPGIPTVVVGHSLGGFAALLGAALYPESVDGVLAIAPFTDLRAVIGVKKVPGISSWELA